MQINVDFCQLHSGSAIFTVETKRSTPRSIQLAKFHNNENVEFQKCNY